MTHISNIEAREILDSRGNPTLEVSVLVGDMIFTAAVPSGASTGIHEALELRDGGKRYLGMGVTKAIRNVERKIAPLLKGIDCTKQREIDQMMIKADGTHDKSRFGANAILGVSLACARAGAEMNDLYLYEYINQLLTVKKSLQMPRLFFNIINCGKHADNALSFQEFMVVPTFSSVQKNIQAASEIYHILKKEIHQKYGKGTTNVGDEGGFAPEQFKRAEDALQLLQKAIRDAGYFGRVGIAIDCAASE